MHKKRSQTAIEFLTLFGFVFLMIIPLVIIFFTQSNEAQDALNSNQLRNIATKIADKAETVYYLGEPSKTTLKVYFPERVTAVTISNGEIVFEYRTVNNIVQQIVQNVRVNLSGNVSPSSGVHYIKIESVQGATGEYVSVVDV